MVQYNRLTSETAIIDYIKGLERKIAEEATRGTGDIVIADPDTGVETIIGTLPDGTTGLQEFVGDIEPPPVTTPPIVSAQPGSFVVTWDGLFLGGMTAPRDFVHVNVIGHKMDGANILLSVPVGVIRISTESVIVSTDVATGGESWAFTLASEDYSGNVATESDPSAPLMMIDALSVVDTAWTDLKSDVETSQQAAQDAQTAADTAQDAADAAKLAADRAIESSAKVYRRTGKTAAGIVTGSGLIQSGMVSVASDGAPGGFALQKTGTADNNIYDLSGMQDFNPDLLYRVSFKVRVVTNATVLPKTLYAGIVGFKADGTTPVASTGATSFTGGHYFAASNAAITSADGWKTYTGYFKGHAASGNGGQKVSPLSPGTVHTNVRKIAPMALLDYNGGDGVWEVASIELDVVTSEAQKALSDAAAAQQKADQAFNNAASAATAAGNAQTSADGKNRIWYQGTAPTGIDHKINDSWFDTANDHRLSKWDGDSWELSLIGNSAIFGNLDAGKMTVGDLDAARIKTKSLGVDKLMITSTDNLLMEGDFSNNGTSWQTSATKSVVATAGRAGLPAMRFTDLAGTITSLNVNNRIPISPDARFRGSMWVKSSAAAVAGAFKIVGRFYSTLTAFTDIDIAISPAVVAATWTNVEGIVPATIPSNTIAVEFYISVTNAAAGDITDIDFISVTRAADGKLIVDGAVTAEKLESELVLATKIIAGDPIGTRAEMASDGFRVFAKDDPADPDSPVSEVVRMGVASSNDYFAVVRADGTLAASMSQDGTVSATALTVENDIEWKGESLTGLYDALPKGMVAWGSRSSNSAYWATSAQPYLSLTFDGKAGRAYRVSTTPIAMDGDSTTAFGQINMHYAVGTTISTADSIISSATVPPANGFTGRRSPVTFNRLLTVTTDAPHSLLISYSGVSPGRAKIIGTVPYAVILTVEDIGLSPAETGESPNGSGDGAATNPAPPPAKINYTKTYYPIDTQSYTGTGAPYEYNVSSMYSGLSPAGYGDLRSMALFGSQIATDVGAGTITKVRVYAYYDHWYYNSGGTADITVYGGTSLPGTLPTVSGTTIASSSWPKPGGRWVTLNSATFAGIKAGTSRGIIFGGKNRGYLGYGILHDVRLEVSYTK